MPFTGSLAHLTITGSEYLADLSSGQMVFHVETPHALTQAAGYLKYIGGQQGKGIFFRGQTRLHNALIPSLFRGISSQKADNFRKKQLNEAIRAIVSLSRMLRTVPEYAHEPLLQHYGLRTTWIDLVDNVWVALWFACFHAHGSGPLGQYLHFERRAGEDPRVQYAYVLLVVVDAPGPSVYTPGLQRGSETEVIDLRIACPSTFLRPHAQHGVLFRLRGHGARRPLDYHAQVCGIIRISLRDAAVCLGE